MTPSGTGEHLTVLHFLVTLVAHGATSSRGWVGASQRCSKKHAQSPRYAAEGRENGANPAQAEDGEAFQRK